MEEAGVPPGRRGREEVGEDIWKFCLPVSLSPSHREKSWDFDDIPRRFCILRYLQLHRQLLLGSC